MKNFTPVFILSVIVTTLFIIWGLIPQNVLPNGNINVVTSTVQAFIIEKFGWFYLLTATFFLIFAISLIFSKYGHVKLGKDTDEPEYSYLSWFAMLFSAGMGIGLVFWGVSEPIFHYSGPPAGEGFTNQAGRDALRYSSFIGACILGLFIQQ